jgi:hypothetical protein
MAFHVDEGKLELNFTTFCEYSPNRQAETLEAIAETVKSDEMPLKSYLLTHGDAKLTVEQKQLLINWAKEARQRITALPTP